MNLQTIEKAEMSDGKILDVVDIFPTIQGEGPYSGERAIFIRFAGCNLQCPECDTDYTTNRRKMTIEDIVSKVKEIANDNFKNLEEASNLIVLTGGEPYRQNISSLMWQLDQAEFNFELQVETNGTIPPFEPSHGLPDHVIVLSPKTPILHSYFYKKSDYWKYVIEAGKVDEADGLPTSVLGNNIRPSRPTSGFLNKNIYVSPCEPDSKVGSDEYKANVQAAVKSAMKFGYTLSLQTHKYLGVK